MTITSEKTTTYTLVLVTDELETIAAVLGEASKAGHGGHGSPVSLYGKMLAALRENGEGKQETLSRIWKEVKL